MKKSLIISSLVLALLAAGYVNSAPVTPEFGADSARGAVAISFLTNTTTSVHGGAVELTDATGKKQWIAFPDDSDAAHLSGHGRPDGYHLVALLAPGKYAVTRWALSSAASDASVALPQQALTFDVVSGHAQYLGALDVRRIGRKAQFVDRFTQDRSTFLRELPSLASVTFEDKSFATGWWNLPTVTDTQLYVASVTATAAN